MELFLCQIRHCYYCISNLRHEYETLCCWFISYIVNENESLLPDIYSLFLLHSEETKSNGFTILVDAQREAWRVARGCIRESSAACGTNIAVFVIVLRSDGFWEKHVDNCTKSHKAGEVSSAKFHL